MELTLTNNYYAFSATPDMTATVTVNDGSLDYANAASGPFQKVGSINAGESHEFEMPGVLLAAATATFEIDHAHPPVTDPDPALMSEPPQVEDS